MAPSFEAVSCIILSLLVMDIHGLTVTMFIEHTVQPEVLDELTMVDTTQSSFFSQAGRGATVG